MLTGYDDVLRRLADVDRDLAEANLQQPLRVTLIGGAAVMVYGGSRWSQDVDVTPSWSSPAYGLAGVFSRHGIHVVPDVLINLHPDWHERVRELPGVRFNHLQVTVLDPHDLAVSKIARGAQRDLEDLRSLKSELDPTRVRNLYMEAMTYWIGNHDQFEGALRLAFRDVFGQELS